MSAGETVVWCFAIICATVLLGAVLLVWAVQIIEKKDKNYEALEMAYQDALRDLDSLRK